MKLAGALLFFWLPICVGEEVAWQTAPGCRFTKLTVPATGKTGFTLLESASLGIDFTNHLSIDRVRHFQNLMNGAGLACGDIDEDGRVDLYFCHKQGSNGLFRNLGGGRFTNITASAGVGCTNMISVGAVFADLNGDRHLDLLVTSFGGPHACFLGDGHGHFSDITASSGFSNPSKTGSTSMALGDLDGDGDLDLYVCNFGTLAVLRDGGQLSERIINGVPTVTGRFARKVRIVDGRYLEYGDPDVLLLNDGTGHFTTAPWETHFSDEDDGPMEPPWDFGLAVQIRDINSDGQPDIYVCNDFQTPDRIWLGDGHGHFRALPRFALRNMSYASMGVDFADIDRDGWFDFVTAEMLSPGRVHHLRAGAPGEPQLRLPGLGVDREDFGRNCLYRNRGDSTWEEIACFAGVAATDWSWTPLFLDVDLDGWEDLLVSNGHLFDVNDRDVNSRIKAQRGRDIRGRRDLLQQYPALEPPKFAFRNRHDLTFENVGDAWGFNSTRMAHGMAVADLDGDGDLDVVLNCPNDPPLIYRNDTTGPRVAVRLKGAKPNTQAIGAKVTLRGGPVVQSQEIVAGGQYLSHSDPMRVFAVGANTGGMGLELEVIWRSGRRSVVPDVKPNHLYEIDEAGGSEAVARQGAPTQSPAPLFEDATAKLGHVHHEEPFDDFAQQPLLPRRFGQLGPGVAVFDVNADGHDDVIVGEGRGGQLTVHFGDGRGGFLRSEPFPGGPLRDDVTGLVAFRGSSGEVTLLAGVANYESGQLNTPSVLRFDFRDGRWTVGEAIPGNGSSTGPLAVGDLTGDGTLQLFVGGRLVPRRYPEPAGSRLFRFEGGRLVLDEQRTKALDGVGMVSSARFLPRGEKSGSRLVLACDWGPVRAFEPGGSAGLHEVTAELGLDRLTGWWNSVAAGDFDGDGALDLIAGNWGLNSLWQVWTGTPPRIAFGEFEGDGTIQDLEALEVPGGRLLPWRDLETFRAAAPGLVAGVASHQQFASSSLDDLMGARATQARRLTVNTLATTLLLNRGDHFEPRPLPREAQMTPVFGISVADFDGDGNEDVFLAQNLFALRPEDGRLDAGRGLLLRGDGKGGFAAVLGQGTGIAVYGEQRGSAVGDFDEDGRADLVVTQNGAPTRVWHNVGANPGLRVKLSVPGLVVRAKTGDQTGPARFAGASGYWSQDSLTTVVSATREVRAVIVSGAGGATREIPVPPGAKSIEVR